MPNVSHSVNNFPVQETQHAKKVEPPKPAKPPVSEDMTAEPMPNIIDGIDGNHFAPGGCVIMPDIFKDGPSQIIEQTLNTALLAKMPGAERVALNSFYGDLKGMTPGELDDMKDAIVKQMASPDTSQRERDVLKKMYEIADAMSENRPAPHVFDKVKGNKIPGLPPNIIDDGKWNHWDKLNPVPHPPKPISSEDSEDFITELK